MKKKTPPKRSEAFSLRAQKALGQNFLVDTSIIHDIVHVVQEQGQSQGTIHVHEIGPGTGAMTRALLKAGFVVTAVEKDSRCVDGLRETLVSAYPKSLSLEHKDILAWRPEETIPNHRPLCVGNLPYYITTPILQWFCCRLEYYSCGIFMMQKEVAQRLQALHRTKAYGRLSIKIQLLMDVQLLFVVPAACFAPKPKVDSAIVLLTPKGNPFSSVEEEDFFDAFTHTLFSARRKMIKKTIAGYLDVLAQNNPLAFKSFWQQMASIQITEETRPDHIPVETIYRLHMLFWKNR